MSRCVTAGAQKVSVASAAIEVMHPNVYGIDMAANRFSRQWQVTEEIKDFLGCDNLVYQDLEDLISSVMELNPELDGVEKSIFDGEYPTNISDEYLDT